MSFELNSRINNILQRIANILLLNASFIENPGLLNGKMGIAIFFNHYGKYTNNDIYTNYASELIDEIYEEINNRMPIDFADGLTGIGWGIEHLVQNGFLEADTDEVLEDIDDVVYQKILMLPTLDELKGCFLYQIARFNARNKDSNSKELLKTHTLLCLLGECEKILVYRNFKDSTSFPDVDILRAIEFFLIQIDKIGLFPKKTKKLLECFYTFFEIAETKAKESENISVIDRASSLFLLKLIYSLKDSYEDNIDIFLKGFEFIEQEENWNKNLKKNNLNNLGLEQGLAGIGMFIMDIVVSNNNISKPFNSKTILNEKTKMNVFLEMFDFSGVKTYINELSKFLSSREDINLYLLDLKCTKLNEFTIEKADNNTIIHIPYNNRKTELKKYQKQVALLIYKDFRDLNNIVFHFNFSEHVYFAQEIKLLFKSKIIYTLHFVESHYTYEDWISAEGRENDIVNDKLQIEMTNLADQIICVTALIKRVLQSKFAINKDKMTLIYNGKALERTIITVDKKRMIKNELGFESNELIILFAGKLEQRKGINKLLEAFGFVLNKFTNVRLVIAGDGNFLKYMSLAKKYIGKVSFTGLLSKEELVQLYQIANIGVIPSEYEQCSYVAIEMMQYALPIIITDVPGLTELFTQEKNVLKCKVRVKTNNGLCLEADEIDLAEQILKLLNNQEYAEELGKNAYQNAIDNFSVELMGTKTVEAYTKLN